MTLGVYHWSPHIRLRCASSAELLAALQAAQRERPDAALDLRIPTAMPPPPGSASLLRAPRWDAARQAAAGSWVLYRDSSGSVGFAVDPD